MLFEERASISAEVIAEQHSCFIGASSYMNSYGYIRGDVFIGRYCSIGRRVTIGAEAHLMTGLSTSPSLSGGPAQSNYSAEALMELGFDTIKHSRRQTVIRSDVWVGDGAIILPGVTIGIGAVVGANAVVVRDVAPYEIVGGVPSKVIRKRFPSGVCDLLLASEWWELPLDFLKKQNTGNVFKFLDAVGAEGSSENKVYETFSVTA
ncbi:MAG: CatB-related O-acetyltransferase [Alteromonadaceae bacterium]|nr:CatB-related O-acetyltransferase [Alteromonadaceae bacterium]